ncbi:hypothetical protein DSO57_1025259 [Entomophthora muscae]|uniref:Uncharacterized protein n=1 Tax=Entomophthora muscae TaxID=34485 RepID=A0ACC2U0T6_9FUNG|nr:hypothetical protein DSO57_1025259 [Entomophthora muscae]
MSFLKSGLALKSVPNYFPKSIPANYAKFSKIGDDACNIDTPSLVVDLDAFEYNLKLLPNIVESISAKGQNIKIRPHYKSHKCPSISVLQHEIGGATGICCAKITEAETLVFGSQSSRAWDILITNQVASERKMERIYNVIKKLAENPQSAPLGVCVDDFFQISLLEMMLASTSFKLDVYIELNVGQERCGVNSPAEALELAQRITSFTSFNFKGLLAYNGSNQHNRSHLERSETVMSSSFKGKIISCLDTFKENDIKCQIVTGGGTGSFPYEIQSGVFQEIQPGSYIFMDADYYSNFTELGDHNHAFKKSLFVYSRIQSLKGLDSLNPRIIVDAGLKAISLDSGPPEVLLPQDYPKFEYLNQGDEHGKLVPPIGCIVGSKQFKLGEIIKLVPGHCDPTVNMVRS